MEEIRQLRVEAIPQFQEGISLTLSHWDALVAGISNGFGSPDRIPDFALRIFTFFHQPHRKEPIYIDDLEDLLWDGLVSFGIVAEDGSIEEVAEDLMTMHLECLDGNYESIQKLKRVKRAPIPPQIESDEDCEENDENTENDETSDMMVDSQGSFPNPNHPTITQKTESSAQPMGEDADGFVTVSYKKNKGRKH